MCVHTPQEYTERAQAPDRWTTQRTLIAACIRIEGRTHGLRTQPRGGPRAPFVERSNLMRIPISGRDSLSPMTDAHPGFI